MKYFAKYFIAAILISAGYYSQAQNIYENYLPQPAIDTTKVGNVSIHFYNNNFIKNNEYFGPYTEGITYIGSILQPEVTWALSNSFSLSGGWYFRQYYGQNGFNQSIPVIRATYTFRPGARFIIGQLNGRLQHGYVEPIYSTDNYFTKKPEYGVQFLVDREKLHTDIYMDWEQFELPGDDHQEIITGGLLASYALSGMLIFKVLYIILADRLINPITLCSRGLTWSADCSTHF
jgi:hypothetical protein